MKVTLETVFTPYTLDTYGTFDIGNSDEREIEWYNEEHGTNYGYDDFDWDYDCDGYNKELAENLLHLLQQNIIDDVVLKVNSDCEVQSPREYNFTTDKIWLDFEIDKGKLEKFIEDNEKDYNENKLKSYDGFMWFGDDEQTKLNYYLRKKSTELLDPEDYFMEQYESIETHEYVKMELIIKD